MRTPVTTLALLGLVPLRPPRAAAWHAEGRVAPAQVARQLSDKRRAALGQILKARPHGATVPGARRPEDTPPAQGAFAPAPTRPDRALVILPSAHPNDTAPRRRRRPPGRAGAGARRQGRCAAGPDGPQRELCSQVALTAPFTF
jgi:hypothetical protein